MDNEYYGFVYITTNLANGKKYIGQKKIRNGWREYLGSGTAFKKAVAKYGRDNFKRNIVCFCKTPEELNNAERDISVFLDVLNNDDWYNLCYGGGTVSGYHPTTDTLNKMSKANKGENNPAYGRRGEKHPHWGRHWSEEAKRKMSLKQSGSNSAWWGRHHTEEEKTKQRANCPQSKRVRIVFADGAEKIFLSVNEASQALGCNRKTIISIIRDGRPVKRGVLSGTTAKYM